MGFNRFALNSSTSVEIPLRICTMGNSRRCSEIQQNYPETVAIQQHGTFMHHVMELGQTKGGGVVWGKEAGPLSHKDQVTIINFPEAHVDTIRVSAHILEP